MNLDEAGGLIYSLADSAEWTVSGFVAVISFLESLYKHGFSIESTYTGEDYEKQMERYFPGDSQPNPGDGIDPAPKSSL